MSVRTMSQRLKLTIALLLGITVLSWGAEEPAESAVDPAWGSPLRWSQFAHVETLPGMQAIRHLDDGDPTTRGIWCPGTEGGGEIAIRFPEPLEITQFRLFQHGGGATTFRLTADTDGNGAFTTLIAERNDPKAVTGTFLSIAVDRRVHGLKLTCVEGSSGYRAPFPVLGEIEVYSKTAVSPARRPAAPAPALSLGTEKPLPEFTRKEIDIRLCIDTWHAGLHAKADPAALEQNPTFNAMLARFKEADANSARLFCETGCSANEMPWKSDNLWPGHGRDQLGPLARALQKNGLKLYFFTHAWISPFQKRGERAKMPYSRWDYPYEQSDRLVGVDDHYKVTYPCVISDSSFHDNWLQLLREALQQGADGVYLMPDEYYFKGHNLSRVDCPPCEAAFKEMYGYDSLPTGGGFTVDRSGGTVVINRGKIEDTEKYRKWKLFEYRKIAGLYHSISAQLRQEFPDAEIAMSDNKVTEDLSGRLEHTMALDIIEKDPHADLAQMYGNAPLDRVGWISAYVRRIAAAAGEEKLLASIQWLGVQNTPTDYPIQLFGYALPQIMLGARAYENYRLNYMYDKGWWPNVLECHKMIRLLEQWDVQEARTPQVATLILSRASEDWWRTRQEGLSGTPGSEDVAFNLLYAGDDINKSAAKAEGSERDRLLKLDALRGVGSKLAMESFLCEAGIPYRVAFAERLDNLQNLAHNKLLIMPFCYSLSTEAFAKIEAAVEAGSTLVVFGPLAPTDEYGNPHPDPLLKSLIGKPNVIHVEDNLAVVGNSTAKRAEYAKLIKPVLEPVGYGCESNGQPVECIVRELPEGQGYLVYLGNWSHSPARPIVSLPPLNDDGKLEVYSSATKTLTDAEVADLSRFAVELAPAEVKLLRIQRTN